MNHEPFEGTISLRLAALEALVVALDALSRDSIEWRRVRAGRVAGELRNLLGRLLDTDEDDWVTGAAASWLSPLDVAELRNGLLTALYRAEAPAFPVSPDQADELEALADALDTYIESPPHRA